MHHFNHFVAFCLMAISGVFTTINAARKPIAAIFLAVIFTVPSAHAVGENVGKNSARIVKKAIDNAADTLLQAISKLQPILIAFTIVMFAVFCALAIIAYRLKQRQNCVSNSPPPSSAANLLAIFIASALINFAVTPTAYACHPECEVHYGLNWKTATADEVRQWHKNGGDLYADSKDAGLPLQEAIYFGNLAAMETLLDLGADVNAKDDKGRISLHWAASNSENPEVITMLIDLGADVHAESSFIDEDTGKEVTLGKPLHRALFNPNYKEIIAALVASGADINAKSKFGDTALDWAQGPAKDNAQPGVAAYLSNPAEMNRVRREYVRRTNARKFPLIAAVLDGDADKVRLVINTVIDVNQTDGGGKTAFDYAVEKGRKDIAKILFQSGGKPASKLQ